MKTINTHSLLATIFPVILLGACEKKAALPTIDTIDINMYAGTWYEIERLPNRFEKDLNCVSATYTLREDGKIDVLNRGQKISDPGTFKEIKGMAWQPDKGKPGALKVRFFWPFAGDYYIIELSPLYQYALVGDPSRKYLWILSRAVSLDETTIRELKDKAKSLGFNTDEMIVVDQECNKLGRN